MIGPGESGHCQLEDGHEGEHIVEWNRADGAAMKSRWQVLEE
jgi:hypothetical protein